MRCPNCGSNYLDEHINSTGGGGRYCLDGCGFEEEIPEGTRKPPREEVEPPRPRPKKPPRR